MPQTSHSPLIAVAIPTFNGARFVAEAVRSVLAQERPEPAPLLLVVDDRSEDDTLERVRSVAGDRVRIEVNGERLGLAGNWNRCVDLAGAPWAAIFHQDDVMRPGHLAAQAACVTQRPDVGFVCGAFDVIDGSGQPVSERVIERARLNSRGYEAGEFVAELAVRNPVRCSTVTLSAKAHRAVGGFDPRWKYVVDWDFWFRVAKQYPVAWMESASVAVRWHEGSETSRFRRGIEDLQEVGRLQERIQAWGTAVWRDGTERKRRAGRLLGRAYLNRVDTALRAGDAGLARRALFMARLHNPRIGLELLRHPGLAWRLARLGRRRESAEGVEDARDGDLETG